METGRCSICVDIAHVVPPNSNAQIMALRHTTTHSLLPPSLFAVRQAGILGQNERCTKGAAAQKRHQQTKPTILLPRSLTHALPPLRKGVLIRSLVRSVQQISHLHVSLVLVVKFGRRFHSIPAFIIINAIGFSKGASHVSKRHVWMGTGRGRGERRRGLPICCLSLSLSRGTISYPDSLQCPVRQRRQHSTASKFYYHPPTVHLFEPSCADLRSCQ